MAESNLLAGRQIVVTGGTGALGRAVVNRLLAEGASCHVPSHRAEAEGATPGLHITPGVDLTDEDSVAGFYAGIENLWASVHLAGGFAMSPIGEATASDLRRMLEMNVVTTFLCAHEAVKAMRRTGNGGRIVNVAARPALEPRKGARMAAYAASKAAVAAMTEGLAEELKADHILVNAIAPSTIDSEANRKAMPKADPARWLSPEAAAEVVLTLVLPGKTAISGAVLPLYALA
ncbi:MAG: SDR family NAD(P)-dependent oxidoreductase [Rubellimicrobium sp.]|nr:SDR family NAD(P)-dependent oxidoreductase [Rubellimicrobium sp.]